MGAGGVMGLFDNYKAIPRGYVYREFCCICEEDYLYHFDYLHGSESFTLDADEISEFQVIINGQLMFPNGDLSELKRFSEVVEGSGVVFGKGNGLTVSIEKGFDSSDFIKIRVKAKASGVIKIYFKQEIR